MGLLDQIYPGLNIKYSSPYGIIKVLEGRLISRDKLERIAGTEGLENAIVRLTDTPYEQDSQSMLEEYRHQHVTAKGISEIFQNEINATFNEIKSITPDETILRLFQIYLDSHNLKLLLKYKFAEMGEMESTQGGIRSADYDRIRELMFDYKNMLLPASRVDEIYKEQMSDIPTHIDDEHLKPIARKSIDHILEFETEHEFRGTEFLIESIVDRETYSVMYEQAGTIETVNDEERKILDDYIEYLIDIANIKLFIRAAHLKKGEDYITEVLIPNGTFTKGFTSKLKISDPDRVIEMLKSTRYRDLVDEWVEGGKGLEKLDLIAGKGIDRIMERARYISLSPLSIIYFLYRKEREIETLRGILIAKSYGLSLEDMEGVIFGG